MNKGQAESLTHDYSEYTTETLVASMRALLRVMENGANVSLELAHIGIELIRRGVDLAIFDKTVGV